MEKAAGLPAHLAGARNPRSAEKKSGSRIILRNPLKKAIVAMYDACNVALQHGATSTISR
jgi:hypothetical protein